MVFLEPLHNNQIRVVSLHPGEYQSPLACQIHVVDIADVSVPYEAISYVWGSQEAHSVVSCSTGTDGRRVDIPIPQNAASVLRAVREVHSDRVIWIDVVCVNQTSAAEKSVQVAMMDQVFASARSVLVWLGPTDEMRPTMAEGLFMRMAEWGQDETHEPVQTMPYSTSMYLGAGLDYSPEEVGVLLNVFESRWFWRLWCVQELVLAKKASVYWGPTRMPWEVFSNVALYVQARKEHEVAQIGLGGIYNVAMLESFRRQVREPAHKRLPFSRLLSLTRQHGVTEHFDRIFSLLGLDRRLCIVPNGASAEQEAPLVTPDYTKKIEELYLRIAKRLLTREGNLYLLSFVQHEREVGSGMTPSWVPHWHINKHQLITQFDLLLGHPVNICMNQIWLESSAGSHANPSQMSQQPFDIGDDNSLHVDGFILATVWFKCSDAVFESDNGDEWMNKLREWFQSFLGWFTWQPQSFGRQPQMVEDAAFRVFYRTLFAGHLRLGDISKRLRQELEAFRALLHSSSAENTDRCQTTCAIILQVCRSRTLFVTTSGRLGIGPQCAQPGDSICVLSGAAVPLLLRSRPSHVDRWFLVGETYVNGLLSTSRDYKVAEAPPTMQSRLKELEHRLMGRPRKVITDLPHPSSKANVAKHRRRANTFMRVPQMPHFSFARLGHEYASESRDIDVSETEVWARFKEAEASDWWSEGQEDESVDEMGCRVRFIID